MNLPNFLLCGAQRSGTTSLYHYLVQHPAVFMASQKEIHFFSKEYARGLAWYAGHFTDANMATVIGEASPTYMDTPGVAARIAQHLPDVKLCFLLRNPIDRAYSSYWHSIAMGKSLNESFSAAIRSPEGYARYVQRGFYMQYLTEYLNYFERSQIHIILTEELNRDPQQVLRNCFAFMEIDGSFEPNTAVQFNASQTASGQVNLSLLHKWRQVKRVVLRSQLISPAWRRKTAPLRTAVARVLLPQVNHQVPTMNPDDYAYLAEIYAEANAALFAFLKRPSPTFARVVISEN
ncbi:MAG: sulfotransferase domain-containing protein [Caldilineaceae bacterium]|nr:sulfotransferase domain-containing protein [Caldilineaceae bacterium]